jgi:hypothetical protein
MRCRIFLSLFFLCSGLPWSRATTIVVKMEKGRIILAADTRRSVLTVNPFTPTTYFDDNCKIVTVGKVGVGITGNSDYRVVDTGDPVAAWDAREDAKAVLLEHRGDLSAIADQWQKKAVSHFVSFFRANPNRVRGYANSKNELLEGLFAGWDRKHRPELIVVKIVVDALVPDGISGNASVFGVRDMPYTSNEITRELIEEPLEQSRNVSTNWASESEHVPQSERGWRYVEFIIKATADYDPTVGKVANVLELLPYRRYKWIQNNCCPK